MPHMNVFELLGGLADALDPANFRQLFPEHDPEQAAHIDAVIEGKDPERLRQLVCLHEARKQELTEAQLERIAALLAKKDLTYVCDHLPDTEAGSTLCNIA